MKYKVHTAYINNNGTIIPSGIYDESVLDLAEARYKSIITLADVELETTIKDREDIIKVKPVNNSYYEETKDFKEINLEPEIKVVSVKTIDINTEAEEVIAKIKYVGKGQAKKVVSERTKQRFVSYIDLDNRVPLSFSKKWQDISALTFSTDESVQPYREYSESV